jgi:hypothetical protein
MRTHSRTATALATALLLAACGKPAQDTSMPEADAAASAAVTAAIPASLAPFGEGWPKAGDPCRRLGESAATANWLDDSAVLVGCPTVEAAALLGGKTLATVEGVTVVSVPMGDANAGMVMSDDAHVEGSDFNATAELPCATDGSEPKLRCKAGVKRKWGEDGTTIVVVTRPDGRTRSLYFRETEATGADSAEADGSAAYAFKAIRSGDETRISFGPERYVVPDAFVVGG